jgi:AcrR family transcriptional regulator
VGRRPGTAEQTRADLLAAAVRVFSARGYEGSRVSEIAAEAGLSTGAIYANYPNKTELLCAAVRAGGPKAIAGLMDAGRCGSALDVLKAMGNRLAGVPKATSRKASAARAILIESLAASRREPQVAEVLRTSLGEREAMFAALVRRGQQAGEIAPGASVAAIARMCMLLLLGSIVARTVGMPPVPAEEWEAVMATIVGLLQPSKGVG